jgi:2-polyprenyl-6-methoxyphenol hydroxylase-like FAD-dependent oxidoreductase
VPIDVLWFRLTKRSDEPAAVLGRVRQGRILITLDRGDYFQCGSIIRKGSFDEIRRAGLDAFRAGIVAAAPFLAASVDELQSWEQVKLLTVQIDRLPVWHRPGLLCIGDAAHAMSPAGGVGINLAVGDAVATANLLAEKLREHRLGDDDLRAVQRRRELPVRLIQAGQVFAHRRMFGPDGRPFPFSWPARKAIALLAPLLRRAGAWVVGVGFRAEHVQVAERL